MLPLTLPSNNSISSVYAGDTWRGITLTIEPEEGEVMFSPLALVRMQIRCTDGTFAYEFTSAEDKPADSGAATIINAEQWNFSIPPTVLPIPAGFYVWDIETTDEVGIVRTVLKGTLRICPDITNGES